MPAAPGAVYPAYQIYADQLASLGHGIGLWEPAPQEDCDRVRIGDLGYVRHGHFLTIFNITGPLNGRIPSSDVPADVVGDLEIGHILRRQPRRAGPIFSKSIRDRGGSGDISVNTPVLNPGVTLSFNARSEAGALLMTKHQTFSEDMKLHRTFKRQFLKHYRAWVTFAQDQGHDVELEDLILVTGLDVTQDFAMLAFANDSGDFDINFQVGASQCATGSVGAWGSWRVANSAHENWGPQETAPPGTIRSASALRTTTSAGESSNAIPNDEYRQCVFIRGYRIRRRFGVWPQVQNAAAEPQDPAFDRDDEAEVMAIPAGGTADFHDPLQPIFDYIFEHSEARTAVVHDEDFVQLLQLKAARSATSVYDVISQTQPQISFDDREEEVAGLAAAALDTLAAWTNENPPSPGDHALGDGLAPPAPRRQRAISVGVLGNASSPSVPLSMHGPGFRRQRASTLPSNVHLAAAQQFVNDDSPTGDLELDTDVELDLPDGSPASSEWGADDPTSVNTFGALSRVPWRSLPTPKPLDIPLNPLTGIAVGIPIGETSSPMKFAGRDTDLDTEPADSDTDDERLWTVPEEDPLVPAPLPPPTIPEGTASTTYEGFDIGYILDAVGADGSGTGVGRVSNKMTWPARRSRSMASPAGWGRDATAALRRGSVATTRNTNSDDAFMSHLHANDESSMVGQAEWSFGRERAESTRERARVNTRDSKVTHALVHMPVGPDEIWRCAHVGRFSSSWQRKVDGTGQLVSQRLVIKHIRDPYSKATHRGGPQTMVHKHSKAIAYSLFREYNMDSIREAATNTMSMNLGILLAPMRVQVQFTMTKTTRSLNSHVLLYENERREFDPMDVDLDGELPKHKTTHQAAFATLDPASLQHLRAQGDRPESSSIGARFRRLLGVPDRQPRVTVWHDRTFRPPWLSLARRTAQEDHERVIHSLNESFKDVGLLPSLYPSKDRTLTPKRPRASATEDVFNFVPEDSLFMLVPLWPKETDREFQDVKELARREIPVAERQFLVVYYRKTEERREEATVKGKAHEAQSAIAAGALLPHVQPSNDPSQLRSFDVCARLVGYDQLRNSGVRAPSYGLSVSGPLADAFDAIPPPSVREREYDQVVIGLWHSRDVGMELLTEPLERLGLCQARTPDTDINEPVSLNSLGRAVAEMVWVGGMALTAFGGAL